MSVSQQHQFVSRRSLASPFHASSTPPDDLRQRVLHALLAAGRRGASPATTTKAVMACWQWLTCRTIAQRQVLHDALREAVASGQTSTRAWLPVAVAESDPALLRNAVAGYLGCTPRGAEERGQALVDVFEWFRRDLTLDRVAVFAALLALRDEDVNLRLAALRGRLTDAERERLRREFAAACDPSTRAFFDEWQDCARASTAPRIQSD